MSPANGASVEPSTNSLTLTTAKSEWEPMAFGPSPSKTMIEANLERLEFVCHQRRQTRLLSRSNTKSELRVSEFIGAASQPERLTEDRRLHPASGFRSLRIATACTAEDLEFQPVAARIDSPVFANAGLPKQMLLMGGSIEAFGGKSRTARYNLDDRSTVFSATIALRKRTEGIAPQ